MLAVPTAKPLTVKAMFVDPVGIVSPRSVCPATVPIWTMFVPGVQRWSAIAFWTPSTVVTCQVVESVAAIDETLPCGNDRVLMFTFRALKSKYFDVVPKPDSIKGTLTCQTALLPVV